MISKPKKYVLNLAQVTEIDKELVGEPALDLRKLEKAGIPIPHGFVITTTVFDDFLVANDLVDFIAPRINNLDTSEDNPVKRVSHEIQKAILNAKVPEIIKREIEKSYSALSGSVSAFVFIKPSPISDHLDQSKYTQPHSGIEAHGLDALLNRVKEIWAELFSIDALKYRGKVDYEGYVTQSVTIQKIAQSEVAGRIYTVNPADNNEQILEIEAIFGMDDHNVTNEITPDSYFVNKRSEELVEKKSVGQEWMLVRKGRGDKKNPYLKVNISEQWRKRQKIDDRTIINLARIGVTLEEFYEHALQVSFVVEAGRIYIYDIKTIGSVTIEKKAEISHPIRRIEAEPSSGISTSQEPASIDKYLEELGNKGAGQKVQNTTENENEEQVEVNVKPLNMLSKVLSGTTHHKGLAFGIVHFIYTENDWKGLTGDEILVVDRLSLGMLGPLNNVQAIVVSSEVDKELIDQLDIPIISGTPNAYSILHENEVITVDSDAGDIYLGAGKRVQKKVEPAVSRVEVKLPVASSLEEEKEDLVEEKVEEKLEHESITADNIDFTEAKIVDDKKQDNIKTTSNFYQLLDPSSPEVDLNHVDGVYLDIAMFYQSSGYHPEYIMKESKVRREFMESVVRQLKPILKELGGKPLILEASNLTYHQAEKLKGFPGYDRALYKLSRAARLIEFSKLFDFELEIVSIIRNRESLRNLWFAIPDVRTGIEQGEIKKAITSFGFRRSSSFKILSVVDTALGAIEVKELIDNGIDGVVLNIDAIVSDLYKVEVDELTLPVVNFITWVIWAINSNNAQAYILNQKVSLESDWVKDFLAKGLANFVMPLEDIRDSRELIAELESKNLNKKKKRGRKKKKIDYGF